MERPGTLFKMETITNTKLANGDIEVKVTQESTRIMTKDMILKKKAFLEAELHKIMTLLE